MRLYIKIRRNFLRDVSLSHDYHRAREKKLVLTFPIGRHSTQEICPNMGENQRDSLFEKIPGKGINEIKGAACIQYTSQ